MGNPKILVTMLSTTSRSKILNLRLFVFVVLAFAWQTKGNSTDSNVLLSSTVPHSLVTNEHEQQTTSSVDGTFPVTESETTITDGSKFIEQTPSTATCTLNSPFVCASDGECVTRGGTGRQYCNGVEDCSDGSDEIRYNESLHNDDGIRCYVLDPSDKDNPLVRGCFLENKYLCDHQLDCTLGEDECECNHTMLCDSVPSRVRVRDVQCIGRPQFCDNVFNCYDHSDERKYKPGAEGFQCAVTKTRLTNHCMLPTRNVCDGVQDCNEGTDECFCNNGAKAFWNNRCFRCLDELLVIPRKHLCDKTFHCQDLSDECLCDDKPAICSQVCIVNQDCGACQTGEVMCRANGTARSKCIDRSSVCNAAYDCPFQEDELDCNTDVSQLFNCSDGLKYIPKHQQCDNVTDCDDGSDELGCKEQFFECNTFFSSNVNPDAYDFGVPRYAVACDNISSCENLEDECNATLCGEGVPKYCSLVKGSTGFICPNTGGSLIGTEICDGFPTCLVGDPYNSADEFGCPNRFYCDDQETRNLPIHIPESSVCDTVSDCPNDRDELGCKNSTHYYCKGGGLPRYLRRSQVCDGIQDCAKGEDECEQCSTSPFSSDSFLIRSYVLQVFLWMIGLFAVFGNIGVLIHNTRQLIMKRNSSNIVAFNHRALVTNLAAADLLLGLYLIGLGITNTSYQGVYCREDIQWRGSTTCVAIGVMAVISIECSVFLLSIMATMRLFLVTKPFNFHMHRRYILLSILVAWFVSFLLALVPLSSSQLDYFTSEVWYQNNPFLTLANRNKAENLTRYLWSLQSKSTALFTMDLDRSLTWQNMVETISRLDETFVPSLYFGYYSAHGVCLPRIFPNPSADSSWGFSLFLVILNFVTFIYMMCAYMAIYRITMKKSRQAGGMDCDETGLMLQHKISRIIFSNFCCWIPICIMAFISAGGGPVSDEAYAVSAIILLPINSAFNPLLYSDLPEMIWAKFFAKTKFGKWFESRRISRMETRRRKSRASSLTASAHKQTELTRMTTAKYNSTQSQSEIS